MTYRQRKSRRRRGGKSKFGLALVVLALTTTVAVLSVTGYVLAVAATAPALSELKPIDKGATSVIFPEYKIASGVTIPVTLVVGTVIAAGLAALIASALPARNACRRNPAEVLRAT